jgi:nucleoside phosphorylase
MDDGYSFDAFRADIERRGGKCGHWRVPLLSTLARDLRQWRLKCARPGEDALVFPRFDGAAPDPPSARARTPRDAVATEELAHTIEAKREQEREQRTATDVFGYHSGKAGDTFTPRADVGKSSYALVQRAQAEAQSGDWLAGRLNGDGEPEVIVAPIVAGEQVVASTRSETYAFIRAHYDRAVAVEMEGRGFLAALHANQKVGALVVRGISDLLDEVIVAPIVAGEQVVASTRSESYAFIRAHYDRAVAVEMEGRGFLAALHANQEGRRARRARDLRLARRQGRERSRGLAGACIGERGRVRVRGIGKVIGPLQLKSRVRAARTLTRSRSCAEVAATSPRARPARCGRV